MKSAFEVFWLLSTTDFMETEVYYGFPTAVLRMTLQIPYCIMPISTVYFYHYKYLHVFFKTETVNRSTESPYLDNTIIATLAFDEDDTTVSHSTLLD